MPRRRDRVGTAGGRTRYSGDRPSPDQPRSANADRRSHARTCGWLLDLHFRSANPNATSEVVVGLTPADRPERARRRAVRWLLERGAEQHCGRRRRG